MQKATATYVPPVGDSKVVEMGGMTFFAGQPVELNSDDHAHLMSKLGANGHFDVETREEKDSDQPQKQPAKKRGRPSNADREAARAAAEEADKAVKDAKDKAKAAKEELDATEKAANAPEATDQPRPKTRDMKAGITEAADHNFEQDRRNNMARSGGTAQNVAQNTSRQNYEPPPPKPPSRPASEGPQREHEEP